MEWQVTVESWPCNFSSRTGHQAWHGITACPPFHDYGECMWVQCGPHETLHAVEHRRHWHLGICWREEICFLKEPKTSKNQVFRDPYGIAIGVLRWSIGSAGPLPSVRELRFNAEMPGFPAQSGEADRLNHWKMNQLVSCCHIVWDILWTKATYGSNGFKRIKVKHNYSSFTWKNLHLRTL